MNTEKTFKIKDGDISDGYHTFGELYDATRDLLEAIEFAEVEDDEVIKRPPAKKRFLVKGILYFDESELSKSDGSVNGGPG